MVCFLLVYYKLLLFRSLANEIHELVEFGSDDDLCTAITRATRVGGIVANRIVFAATTCGETCGINSEFLLEHLHH